MVVFIIFTIYACFPGKQIHRAPHAVLPDRSLKAYFYPTDSCKCLLLILIKINLEVLKNKAVLNCVPCDFIHPQAATARLQGSDLMPLLDLHTGEQVYFTVFPLLTRCKLQEGQGVCLFFHILFLKPRIVAYSGFSSVFVD